jgi:hypothetical protein
LADPAQQPQWLIEALWAEQAVGILGGEPKCCKSFLALDIAVSVASATPCLRHFPVRRSGPVLLFPAEDSLGTVRQRLEGICTAAHTRFDTLPLYVITAPRLLLDLPQDRQRLRETVAALQPVLLVLDPFIRLHRSDENASKEIAPLLGYLRDLQRQFHLAVLLVHHVRKGSNTKRPGQSLRGTSDLHGWGDSNLYLRRHNQQLSLSVEHRAAPSQENIPLQLRSRGKALALSLTDPSPPPKPQHSAPSQRVLHTMAQLNRPASTQQLRKLCRIRTATLCDTLAELTAQGRVEHGPHGYCLTQLHDQPIVSFPYTPIQPAGNGNGKPSSPSSCTPAQHISAEIPHTSENPPPAYRHPSKHPTK